MALGWFWTICLWLMQPIHIPTIMAVQLIYVVDSYERPTDALSDDGSPRGHCSRREESYIGDESYVPTQWGIDQRRTRGRGYS